MLTGALWGGPRGSGSDAPALISLGRGWGARGLLGVRGQGADARSASPPLPAPSSQTVVNSCRFV